jgi:hypothetical protein
MVSPNPKSNHGTHVIAGKIVRYRPDAIIFNSPEAYQGTAHPLPSLYRSDWERYLWQHEENPKV